MVRNEEKRANRNTAIRQKKRKRKKLGWRTAARKKRRTAANWSEMKRREPIRIQK